MDDILLLQATERYLNGDMPAEERGFFENLRKTNPEIDQLVVEHIFMLNELDKLGNTRNYKHAMQVVQVKLTGEGVISKSALKGKARISYMW